MCHLLDACIVSNYAGTMAISHSLVGGCNSLLRLYLARSTSSIIPFHNLIVQNNYGLPTYQPVRNLRTLKVYTMTSMHFQKTTRQQYGSEHAWAADMNTDKGICSLTKLKSSNFALCPLPVTQPKWLGFLRGHTMTAFKSPKASSPFLWRGEPLPKTRFHSCLNPLLP